MTRAGRQRHGANLLIPIDHGLQQKAWGLPLVSAHQATVRQHRREVIAEDALE